MVGQKILMVRRFLDRGIFLYNSLFNRQLTGKKQAFENFIYWILKHNWDSRPLQRNIRQNTPNSLPEITGKEQGIKTLLLDFACGYSRINHFDAQDTTCPFYYRAKPIHRSCRTVV